MQSEIKVQYGMTIFDVALATYGSSEYISKILQDNNLSVDFDFTANPGMVIKYDPDYVLPTPSDIVAKPPVIATKATFKAVYGQTLFDVVMMTYGTTDLLVKLLQDNGIDNLNEGDIDQRVFTFETDLIKDNIYYRSLGTYVINTGGEINQSGVPATHFRITSSGEYRITSAGSKRIWE